MKLGIYLGTFDPPHIGHLHVITDCLNKQIVDFVTVVPAKQNPHKTEQPVDFKHRYNMLCNMINDIDDCCISDVEEYIEAPYYSYKTLEKLKIKYDNLNIEELFLIIGDDIDIITWKNVNWILNNFKIIKYSRDTINISSTFVRELLKNNAIVEPYIPKTVIDYINKYNLYKLEN